MKAILVDENKALHWSDVPDPVRKAGEVIMEVKAAALNRADLLQREGKYPPPAGWPVWMGLEVAGIIMEAAPGGRFHVGDRVCALLGGGGYAEQVAVPEELVMPVPDGFSMEESAAIPEAFATAWLNLHYEAGLKPGETILIQAGASGLGTAAIQLAKWMGAQVMTTVGTPEKETLVRTLGADWIVNRKTDNLGDCMEAHPVDVVLDCVGGTGLGENLEKLAVGGRWILISTLGGIEAKIMLRPILKRGLMLKGSTLRSRDNAMKKQILHDLTQEVFPAFEAGSMRPVIHAVLPMERAAEAHAILQRGENLGKVVLTLP